MELERLVADRGGLVSRSELRTAGYGRRSARTRAGLLVPVRRGAYADPARLVVANDLDLLALRIAAACRASSVELIAVGRTAAALQRLPVLGRDDGRLHLAERKSTRSHHGASTTVDEADLVRVRGVLCTGLARTAMDIARGSGFCSGVLAADAALRAGVTRADLLRVLEECRGWPGVKQARQVAEFADGRSESALESLGRVRFHEHGLPPHELQLPVYDDDGLVAYVDHAWPERRTVAEADGALKYKGQADLFAEQQREDRIRDAQLEVVRYTWPEALRRPAVLAARMLRAFARAERFTR